jgi:hypothetical protein
MRRNDIGGALEVRRGEVDRQASAEAQYFKVSGEIEMNGSGEAVIAVSFPVYFVDKPSFSFGAELGAGEPLTAGQLPTGHLVVAQWGERQRDNGSIVYAGATFAVVTTGPATQTLILHWHMEGVGLRGPTPEG